MKEEIVQGLRQLADFLETNPIEIAPPVISIPTWSKPIFHEEVRKLGGFKKKDSDQFLSAVKEFSGGVGIEIYCSKNLTCERVVKGYRTVPAQAAQVIDAVPEHQEPVYGWECPKSFLETETPEPVEAA